MIQPNNIKPSSLCVGVVNTSRGAAAKRSIDADAACMQSSAGATDYSAKVLLSRRSKRGDAASARKTPIACQAIPELNAGVALRLLISMNQNKRSFARRATASKRKSSHHNARSRKHIWFHTVWSRLEQGDQIFVVYIAEFVWDVCTDKSNIRSLGPIAAKEIKGFVGARHSLCRVKLDGTCRCFVCRSNDGLDREFKFFNRLKGGVCRTCAPVDPTKSQESQCE